jgi:hypothetical protein
MQQDCLRDFLSNNRIKDLLPQPFHHAVSDQSDKIGSNIRENSSNKKDAQQYEDNFVEAILGLAAIAAGYRVNKLNGNSTGVS